MSVDLKWLNISDDKVTETQRNSLLTDKLSKIILVAKEELRGLGRSDVATKQQSGKLFKTAFQAYKKWTCKGGFLYGKMPTASEFIATSTHGVLLYHVGTRLKSQCQQYIPLIVRHIMNENIKTELQLFAAIDYLLANTVNGFREVDFLEASGVGIVVTAQEIQKQVEETIDKFKSEILKQRYTFNVGRLIGDVKSKLKWVDVAAVKNEVDLRLMLLLGPKTVDDLYPKRENGTMQKFKRADQASTLRNKKSEEDIVHKEAEGADTIEELMRKKTNFHKVGENYKTDGYIVTSKTPELLKKHVEAVKGKVVTRFPPEPNGILHIGHAKAINIDFGYAKAHGGICYLRFDDTNPEKEEKKFMENIEEMVKWLGYTPYKITHSSDYFEQLYEWAVELIKKQLAYVCHQTVDEMRGFEVANSPWRNRPVDESLRLFADMRHGKFDEGEATLRLKTVLEEGKVDPVAYRIKYCAHHRTGNKWCIYPTYDYTHCLCDSLENITHSLCTKEFQSRRSSYYWLCNALDIYCPVQWEYGRLNINYTVVSKRKIKALIEHKIVNDWDDPRLFTLTALRRRGIPAEAINNFIARLGISTAQTFIDPQMLDAVVRAYLNATVSRTMAVLNPLKVTIKNYMELSLPNTLSVPDFPNDPNRSEQHLVAVNNVIFIEQSDYQQDNKDKNFRRLTRSQPVGLKYLGIVLSVISELKDKEGQVNELIVEASALTTQNKPKAFIHWVAKPVHCQVRLYDRLFKHKNPEDASAVPGGFLSDCNENSLRILDPAYIDQSVAKSKVYDRFQFERVGFFSVDPDSTAAKLVFNRTVDLKEDIGKG